MAKGRVTIDREQCKGCSNCISVCPTKILYLDKGDMNSGDITRQPLQRWKTCIGCANCAMMCPDMCITVERLDKEEGK